MRLFVGIPLPRNAHKILTSTLQRFAPTIQTKVPEERWHMTLVFLGEVPDGSPIQEKLSQPISVPYMPTASVTHVGRGKQKDQLWAYVQATPVLEALQQALAEQLEVSNKRRFVPHIKLANLKTTTGPFDLPDAVAATTFPIREVVLFRSIPGQGDVRYEKLMTVPVTA